LYISKVKNLIDFSDFDKLWGVKESIRQSFDKKINEYSDGFIIEPLKIKQKVLRDFYLQEKLADDNPKLNSRGYKFYQHIDNTIPVYDRIKFIRNDIINNLIILDKLDENDNFNAIAGFLDNLKNQVIVTVILFTFFERTNEQDMSDEYLELRNLLNKQCHEIILIFYKFILGYGVCVFNKNIFNVFDRFFDYIEKNHFKNSERLAAALKQPELDDIYVIIQTALNINLNNSNFDTLVAIPSGGLELSSVVSLIRSLIKEKDLIQPIILNISNYSINNKLNIQNNYKTPYKILSMYESKIFGKIVFIVDDNANSGRTLDKAEYLVKQFQPITCKSFGLSMCCWNYTYNS